jgi:hypothetical protein
VRQLRKTPPATTAGLWHVSTPSDSAVLKVIVEGGVGSRWPSSPDPGHPYYWRREACVYESRVAAAFGTPALRALVERDDGSVALWLEDVPEVAAWTPDLLGGVARRVGRAQALAPPKDEWLSRGWLRAYLELHGVTVGDDVLVRLDALPPVLCHHDLHPANVLAGGVVIDWAYCGLAPAGLDAGVLVADGIADEAFPAEQAGEVADAVWHGYLEGLAGAFDEDDVRFAFVHGTALRLSWLPRAEKPAWDATIDFLERLASAS